MRTLTSLLLGLSMTASMAAPAFAQTAKPAEITALQQCRNEAAGEYRASLVEALTTLRGTINSEWTRQENFRVNAARASQQRLVRNRLDTSGRTYATVLNTFQAAQLRGIDADLNEAVTLYTRLDGTAEETALENWVNRDVTFASLNGTLATMLNRLFLYANTRDRNVIRPIWNEMRQNVEDDYSQARMQARDLFVSSVNDCLMPPAEEDSTDPSQQDNSKKEDVSNSEPAAPAASTDKKDDVPSAAAPAAPSSSADKPAEPAAAATPVSEALSVTAVSAFATSPDFVTSCRNNFILKGMVSATGSGTVKYQWMSSDNRVSNPGNLVFTGADTKTVEVSWPVEDSFTGSFKLMIIDPVSMSSNDVNVKQVCTPAAAAIDALHRPAAEPATEPAAAAPHTDTPATPDKPAASAAPVSRVTGVSINAVTPTNVNSCDAVHFEIHASIAGENLQNVTYRWELPPLSNDPDQSVAGTVLTRFPLVRDYIMPAYSSSESSNTRIVQARLHVLTPTETTSDTITLTRICK